MPRTTGVLPVSAAQYAFWSVWPVLKPVTSCSIPNTSTLFALRPAGVRGTFAHEWANGAAASFGAVATLVDALAVAPATSRATAAPARSQRRLCIDSLRFMCAGSRYEYGGACQLLRPKGVPCPLLRRRGGSLVRAAAACQGAAARTQMATFAPGRAMSREPRPAGAKANRREASAMDVAGSAEAGV